MRGVPPTGTAWCVLAVQWVVYSVLGGGGYPGPRWGVSKDRTGVPPGQDRTGGTPMRTGLG